MVILIVILIVHVGCHVKVNGCPKALKQRLHSSTRPLPGVLPAYAIDSAICFGSAFSGLAYGLEEDLSCYSNLLSVHYQFLLRSTYHENC